MCRHAVAQRETLPRPSRFAPFPRAHSPGGNMGNLLSGASCGTFHQSVGSGSACWGSLYERQRRANNRALQSMTAPPVMLISLAVMVRAQSEAANVAVLATSP
jgi:hypothetical protein